MSLERNSSSSQVQKITAQQWFDPAKKQRKKKEKATDRTQKAALLRPEKPQLNNCRGKLTSAGTTNVIWGANLAGNWPKQDIGQSARIASSFPAEFSRQTLVVADAEGEKEQAWPRSLFKIMQFYRDNRWEREDRSVGARQREVWEWQRERESVREGGETETDGERTNRDRQGKAETSAPGRFVEWVHRASTALAADIHVPVGNICLSPFFSVVCCLFPSLL